jgi:nicotinamide-nucleotide amidase
MEAVAEAVGRPLVLDPAALDLVERGRAGIRRIENIPADVRRGVEQKQAMVPEGAEVIPPAGTAPGAVVHHEGAVIVVLPGPPWEFEEMWRRAVSGSPAVSRLAEGGGAGARRLLRLQGVVESEVAAEIVALPSAIADAVEIGVCARSAEIEVAVRGEDAAVQAVEDALDRAFGGRLYSRDGTTALGVVAASLLSRGETMAVAESCTGGLLGSLLTAEAGSSAWFVGGVIAYANSVKEGVLGVDASTLAHHGAVSAECAGEMALGVQRATGAAWALSVTGIAGPEGGTADKPVGLVYLGLAGPQMQEVVERRFRGDRERVRQAAAMTAIHLLRRALIA